MHLALLLLLALPGSASEPRDLSHDRDGDGVVTGKEERQHRRDERRARRADRRSQRGEAGDDGGSTTEEDDARQAAAAGKASRLADAMKAMLPSADAGAMPGALPGGSGTAAATRPSAAGVPAGDSQQAAAPAPDAGTMPSSRDPANPRSAADLLLAARGPYAPALEKAGLKLSADGRGFVRVADGKPATAEDLERLRASVLAMPAALARRPDFHRHVSPEHFAALQKGYRENRSPSVYKDVGATEKERDFVHTRSCERMSGDCNEHARKKSAYKKGEYVAPEDLARMYAALEEELASSEEEEEAPRAASPRRSGAHGAAEEEELAGPEPGSRAAATPEQKRAAAEAQAFSHTPAFLAEPVRRAIARGTAWLSPTAADSPYLMWRMWLAPAALLALAGLALLRRRD